MAISKFTPPEGSETDTPAEFHGKAFTNVQIDHDTMRLIGTTRFEPLSDVKNILVTGGAGFIGGWITRHLTVTYPEYNIICIDKLDTVSSLANIQCLEMLPNFRFVHCNLLDYDAVSAVLAEQNIDCVLHLAACSHVQSSFEDASSFTVNNVVATQRLLEAVRQHGRVRRFLHVSTDEVYGDAVDEFVDESKQFMPKNPYSASKAAAECYVWAYAKSFDIPALVVRSNNVYGPCQYPEKIIPRFYTLLSQQRPVTIQGSGLNVRRYLHGADAADGLDTLLHRGRVGEAYNISSADGVTNFEVAVRMLGLFGCSPQDDFRNRLTWIADRPFNDHDYRVDGTKLEALGWRQRVPFVEGLASTTEWYRRHLHVWWPEVSKDVNATSTVMTRHSGHQRSEDRQILHGPETTTSRFEEYIAVIQYLQSQH